jgi:uncharacterized membrane protein
MTPELITDIISYVVIAIRVGIIAALSIFLAHYFRIPKPKRRLARVQRIMFCFVGALTVMILQSLSFRVMTIIHYRLSPLNTAIFVAFVAIVVSILLISARIEYKNLLKDIKED